MSYLIALIVALFIGNAIFLHANKPAPAAPPPPAAVEQRAEVPQPPSAVVPPKHKKECVTIRAKGQKEKHQYCRDI